MMLWQAFMTWNYKRRLNVIEKRREKLRAARKFRTAGLMRKVDVASLTVPIFILKTLDHVS